MKFTFVNTIAILVVIAVTPFSAICLKLAAEAWVPGVSLFPLREFVTANGLAGAYFFATLLVGILPPLGTTIALRDNNPNVVFATIGAPTAIVVQLALAWRFQYPMTVWQWVSIGVIVAGALLLRSAKPDPVDEALTEVIAHELEHADKKDEVRADEDDSTLTS